MLTAAVDAAKLYQPGKVAINYEFTRGLNKSASMQEPGVFTVLILTDCHLGISGGKVWVT